MQIHERLQQQLTDGFNKIGEETKGSKDDILAKVGRLLSQQDEIANDHHLNLVSGQQDITTTLERISQAISAVRAETLSNNPETMIELLSEQNTITHLLNSDLKEESQSRSAQMQQLVRITASACERVTDQFQANDLKFTLAKVSDAHHRNERDNHSTGIYVKAEFEFRIRSEIITIHVHVMRFHKLSRADYCSRFDTTRNGSRRDSCREASTLAQFFNFHRIY